jgi:hypothetical protein
MQIIQRAYEELLDYEAPEIHSGEESPLKHKKPRALSVNAQERVLYEEQTRPTFRQVNNMCVDLEFEANGAYDDFTKIREMLKKADIQGFEKYTTIVGQVICNTLLDSIRFDEKASELNGDNVEETKHWTGKKAEAQELCDEIIMVLQSTVATRRQLDELLDELSLLTLGESDETAVTEIWGLLRRLANAP